MDRQGRSCSSILGMAPGPKTNLEGVKPGPQKSEVASRIQSLSQYLSPNGNNVTMHDDFFKTILLEPLASSGPPARCLAAVPRGSLALLPAAALVPAAQARSLCELAGIVSQIKPKIETMVHEHQNKTKHNNLNETKHKLQIKLKIKMNINNT